MHTSILDAGLNVLRSTATRIYLCSQLPTTFVEATTTYALGYKAGISIGAPEPGTPGRKAVIAAITGGIIGTSGRATHYALVDYANSVLLDARSLSAALDIIAGRTWRMAACDIYSSDATGLFVVEEVLGEMTIAIGEAGVAHTFAPVLELHAGYTLGVNASVLWTFSDNSTSSSLTPSHEYTGLEDVKLVVTPWAALASLNAGYDGADGGTETDTLWGVTTALVPNQYVRGFTNFPVAEALETLCILGSPMTDGSILSGAPLIRLEAYNGRLETCVLPATMRRCCIEACSVASLDVSVCAANLQDLRGAENGMTTLTFGSAPFPNLRHICVRQNLLAAMRSINFPALTEFWVWNNPSLTGTLTIDSDTVDSIDAKDCGYTGLDLSGIQTARINVKVWMERNALTSMVLGSDSFEQFHLDGNAGLAVVDLTGQTHIRMFHASGCALTAATIEHILHVLDESGVSSPPGDAVSVDLTGGTNAYLNANAQAHADSLVAKGWTVTYNIEELATDFTEDCEDATPAVGSSLVDPAGLITMPSTAFHHKGLASMRINLNGIAAEHYDEITLSSGIFSFGFAYKAAVLPSGEWYQRIFEVDNVNGAWYRTRITDQGNSGEPTRRITAWIYGTTYILDDIENGQEVRFAISYTPNGTHEIRMYDRTTDTLLGTASASNPESGTPAWVRIGALGSVINIDSSIYFDQFKLDYGTDMHPILV